MPASDLSNSIGADFGRKLSSKVSRLASSAEVIATLRGYWLFVRALVCHDRKSCKNGQLDRAAVWSGGSGEPKKTCIRWGSPPPGEVVNFGESFCAT